MRIVSLLIFSLLLVFFKHQSVSPHGDDFRISCKTCHSPKGWQLDKTIYSFDHNTTRLPLTGQHTQVNCRQCHPTLKFREAKLNCNDCHKDVHQASVGPDCSRCHNSSSWLVKNTNEIHQVSRFPLVGAHRTADCVQCHKSESLVRFDVSGVNCVDCHRDRYIATTNPNHVQAGISEDCILCHSITAFQWSGAGFTHNLFPLTQGHSALKCTDCHKGNYTSTSTDCFSCHAADYNNSVNPGHKALAFATTCNQCHTTNPGWKPAAYTQHDNQFFPIYSGRHRNQWTQCVDCHTNTSNYALFNCIRCHTNAHRNSNYTNAQCYSCHPKGSGE